VGEKSPYLFSFLCAALPLYQTKVRRLDHARGEPNLMYLMAFAKISDTSHHLGRQVVIPKSSILTNKKNKKIFSKNY
jgi:hypothetical protein